VIDKDGDVTPAGAFEDGATVPISAYGHSSWEGVPPIGVGTIRSTAKEAILDGRFFMDQTAGRDTFIAVKELAERGLGEWSYGYDPVEFHFGEHDGTKVRFLDKLKVHEVSPVLVGAGVNTRTRSAKDGDDRGTPWKAIRPHTDLLTDRVWDAMAVVDALEGATIAELRSVFAYCGGDPESKQSYLFPHHHGPGGPANVRAVMFGIAELNSKSCMLPEADRLGVYEHLAGHLADADREPPPLRKAGDPASAVDEVYEALVGARRTVETIVSVAALRSQKGKQLSRVLGQSAEWLRDEWLDVGKALDDVLASPHDLAAREYARFVRQNLLKEFAS
jgi:hypothetical protein